MVKRVATAVVLFANTAWAAPFAYVPGALSNDVTVIDTATNAVVATIPVGLTPIGVAVHPANTRVYVANRDAGTVAEIDPSTHGVVATFPVGNFINAMVVHPDGVRLYVAHFGSQVYASCTYACIGYVSEVDLLSRTVTETFPVGLNINQLTMHPDGVRLYASDNTNDMLNVIDTTTNGIINVIPSGGTQAQSIRFNATGTVGYVANTAGNSVGVFDAVTDTLVTSIPVGNNPGSLALTPDETRLYVPNSGLSYGGGGTISVIDTASNTILTTLVGGPNNSGIDMTADGHAFVTNVGDASLSVLDTAINQVIATIPVGIHPYATGRFITGPAPACTNDLQCVAAPCQAATCTIATGACSMQSIGDGTPCDSGVPDACSMADTCHNGICIAGGGGDLDDDGICDVDDNCPSIPNSDQADLDGDASGNHCDLSDAALTLIKLRFKRTASTTVNGSATVRAEFTIGSAADALTASAGLALRFQDALSTSPEQTWGPAECLTSSQGRISCRSVDRTTRIKIAPIRSVPNGYRVDARLRKQNLQPPFAGPVVVTLAYGESIDRAGSIAPCAMNGSGLKCTP